MCKNQVIKEYVQYAFTCVKNINIYIAVFKY